MKLFWAPKTRSIRVLWMLEEVGADYECIHIDVTKGAGRDNADFMRASPMGKVPALIDGEVAVSDSATICLYLADKFPDGGLAPAIQDPERADYYYWMLFTPGVFEPAMAEKFSQMPVNRGSHGWGDFPSMVAVLRDRLKDRPFLLGDRFMAPDLLVGSSVNFLRQFGGLGEEPDLEAYADRCLDRPAYRRAAAVS